MSLKGGYKILNLKNNPSYDEIAKVLNTEKVILVSGLVVGGVEQKDCFASVEENEGVYTLKTPDKVITIDEDNGVVVKENKETPIYCHPIVIVDDSGNTRSVNIALFIFNNDSTPFTTWEQVRSYIISIVDKIEDIARFLTTGAFIVGNETYVACHIYCQKLEGSSYSLRVEGSKSDGTGATGYLSIYSSTLNVYDGVNKIN